MNWDAHETLHKLNPHPWLPCSQTLSHEFREVLTSQKCGTKTPVTAACLGKSGTWKPFNEAFSRPQQAHKTRCAFLSLKVTMSFSLIAICSRAIVIKHGSTQLFRVKRWTFLCIATLSWFNENNLFFHLFLLLIVVKHNNSMELYYALEIFQLHWCSTSFSFHLLLARSLATLPFIVDDDNVARLKKYKNSKK